MAEPNPVRTSDGPYAMWVIMAGLAAMTVVTLAALFRYSNPSAIVTALGPVTGVIGTLVGAYFGLRGSSLAQQHANQAEAARALNAPVVGGSASPNGHGDAAAILGTPSPPDGARGATADEGDDRELGRRHRP